MLTSCHQTEYHKARRFKYFPIELSIDKFDAASGEVTCTFVTHVDHSFYELTGIYDERSRRVYLEPVRGKIGSGWEPCDAEVYVSQDMTTMSGISICPDHGGCDSGGGEFVLRHDRTRFVVEGAGDARVNGIYTSQPRLPERRLETSVVKQHFYTRGNQQLYDGAPVYLQACPLLLPTCDPFSVVHKIIGNYGFWHIERASSLLATPEEKALQEGPLYSAVSEEIYPPSVGWRPLSADHAPAPNVRAEISSLYSQLSTHEPLISSAALDDERSLSLLLLVATGGLIWLLLVLILRTPLKWKRSAAAKRDAAKADAARARGDVSV